MSRDDSKGALRLLHSVDLSVCPFVTYLGKTME